jgi:hypothetical protein
MKKYAILFSMMTLFVFSSCPVGTGITEQNATPQPSAPGPIANHSPEPVYPEGPAYYDPPTTALGAGRLFDLGPGDYGNPDRTYREVHEFPWLDLIAGDVVRIHHRTEPYRGLIYLRVHGTEEAPVRIYGVAGNGGELPVISGENALMSEELYQYAVDDWTLGLGLIVINDDWNDKPSHIEIANLDLRDASNGYRYGYRDGTGTLVQRPWVRSSGIWLKAGDVSILGCRVHNNNEGIFSQANSDLLGDISSNLLIQGSQIYYNGTPEGSVDENGAPVRNDLDHNLYIQSAGAIIEFCRIGAMRPTSGGSALKDRSSGTVIRYNFIESGARLLDLVEPEDTAGIIVDQTTYVYGNILVNDYAESADSPKSSAMIHFGFDNDPAESRQGSLYFYNNTVFLRCSRTGAAGNWRTRLFEIGREDAIVDSDPVVMQNNLIHVIPSAAGDDPTYFNLLSVFGDLRAGSGNWITSWNSDWCRVIDAGGLPWYDPAEPEPAWGTLTLIDSSHPILTGADPGFIDANAYDFRLSASSPLRGSGAVLPSYLTNSFPVLFQYRDGARHTARSSMDCPGALE